MLQAPDFLVSQTHEAVTRDDVVGVVVLISKLAMILFFLFLTSPTSAHALSKSALTHGLEPLLAEEEDEPSS